jgi:hypothetical protein
MRDNCGYALSIDPEILSLDFEDRSPHQITFTHLLAFEETLGTVMGIESAIL